MTHHRFLNQFSCPTKPHVTLSFRLSDVPEKPYSACGDTSTALQWMICHMRNYLQYRWKDSVTKFLKRNISSIRRFCCRLTSMKSDVFSFFSSICLSRNTRLFLRLYEISCHFHEFFAQFSECLGCICEFYSILFFIVFCCRSRSVQMSSGCFGNTIPFDCFLVCRSVIVSQTRKSVFEGCFPVFEKFIMELLFCRWCHITQTSLGQSWMICVRVQNKKQDDQQKLWKRLCDERDPSIFDEFFLMVPTIMHSLVI